MRTSHRCPKCSHDEVLHVPRIRDSDYDTLCLGVDGVLSKELVGQLESYMCRACGYVELYAQNASSIDPRTLPGARVLKAKPLPPYR
jgi:predicted nucleic-acid-binding Zn-ribbon protein